PEHIFVNQGGTWSALEEELFQCLESRRAQYSLICHLNQPQPAFSKSEMERARTLVTGATRTFFPSAWTQRLAEVQIASAIPRAARFQYPMRFKFDAPLTWPASTHPRIATVARLDADHKGFDLAFLAMATLRNEGHRISLRIYGSGFDEFYLRELAHFL